MTLATTVNGARVVVPGVYSTVQVEDNLSNVVPGPRNILILGEAAKGVPGSLLDLSRTFFTSYEDLKAYFGEGSLVDAARMIFQNQASAVFSGSVNRLYTYKTNQSTRSSRTLQASSSLYATLVAAEYGEDGNLISAQIQDATAEVKPTLTGFWVMKNQADNIVARISGGSALSAALAAEATPAQVATAIAGLSGNLTVSGGALLTIIDGAQVGVDSLSVTVDGTLASRIVVEIDTTFAGADYAAVQVGHVVYIPLASAISGASDENVGAYIVSAKTASSLTLDKISSSSSGGEVAPVEPANVAPALIAGSQSAPATAELLVYSPITVSVSGATAVGTGAALELFTTAGSTNGAQRLWLASAQLSPVSAATALSASVSLTVASSVGTFAISGGSFATIPKVGDVLWVEADSVLRGANSENLGAWIVTAAGSASVVAQKVIAGGASVSSVALASQETPFAIQPTLLSTTLGPKAHSSAAQRQVRLIANRQSDGASFPAATVGGRVVLEISYIGTSALLTITKAGRLQTTVVGGSGANLDLQLAKFATMGDLVAVINSKTGYAARVPSVQLQSLSPKAVLDQVTSVGIAAGHSAQSYAGKIKSDYADFKKLLDDNFGLVALQENTAILAKAGLPDADAAPIFLEGASLGATSNADVLAGLDAALKVEVTQVIPLMSRDAAADVEDGLTDPASSYTVDAINAAVKAHVATASNTEYRKERFGMVSVHSSFEEAKIKSAELSYERLQMAFQQSRAVDSTGAIRWFLPWMSACAVAAGRVQAPLGTSMLRKSFQVSDVKHVGAESVYSDTFLPDFDPDTRELDQAIEAGLMVLRAVTGFGVRMESPDLSTRSRENDPKGWVYERLNVQFVLDEVLKTSRTTLENFIGARTTDVTPAVVRKALQDILQTFVSGGSLKAFSIDSVKLVGNTYKCTISVLPTESVEFVILDVLARRDVGASA